MNKTIENRFFGIFIQGGIASMCVDVLRKKYDLGSSKRKDPLLGEWQEFYFNELSQKIKEAEGALEFDDNALFSEIENNIEEIKNNPKELDKYCATLLAPFAEFLRRVRPIKHRKKEWQKRMEDAELLLKSNNDEDKEFAEELKLRAKEEEERQKEIEMGYWEITQMATKCPPTENFDTYLAERHVEAVFNYIMHILDNYSIRLDWVLAQNGIDLMRLQEECSIYLLEDRLMPRYTHIAGTTEIARKVFGSLREQQGASKTEEVASDNQPPQHERIINKEELRNYFNNEFCGVKPSIVNYFKYLIDDLKIDRNGKDAACIAKLIYESKHMTNKPNTFSAWHRAFCNLADFPYVEYRPNKINTDNIKENFKYLL